MNSRARAETRAKGWSALSLAILLFGVVNAQQSTRDTAKPTASANGLARISGMVISTDAQHQSVRRVIVTLAGAELPGGRAAISDDHGRFVFERLPAGRFTLSGTKPAYLPATYGASKPGRPGIPLQVKAGEQVTGVTLAITHGAAIAGVVHDQDGIPAADISITAFRSPRPGAPPMLVTAGTTTTDDRGVYRIFGLEPGDYFVASTSRTTGGGQINVASTAQIDAALKKLQQRSSQPDSVNASAEAPPPSALPPGAYAYAPMYFPGVASISAATKVPLAAGDDRPGVDFNVLLTRVATIEGSVVSGNGPMPRVIVIINPDGPALPALIGSAPAFSSQATGVGRTFKYTNVSPGRYTIVAESREAADNSWARTQVEVTGDDISGITLVLQPGLHLTGRIVFDGSALAPPDDLTKLRVSLSQLNSVGGSVMNGTNMGSPYVPPAVIESNGRFDISGVLPDTYRFLPVTVPGPTGWWLRSAIVNGKDVLDAPIEIGTTGNITGAVLTFSDRQTTLSGALLTTSGQPAPSHFIVAFPADRALWRPLARRIQSVRAGTDGTWTMRNLPPGDYLLAALADLDPDDLLDPAFFDKLVSASVRISLGEGEQKTQDLKIGG